MNRNENRRYRAWIPDPGIYESNKKEIRFSLHAEDQNGSVKLRIRHQRACYGGNGNDPHY